MKDEGIAQQQNRDSDSTNELIRAAEALFASEEPGALADIPRPDIKAKVSGNRDAQKKKK